MVGKIEKMNLIIGLLLAVAAGGIWRDAKAVISVVAGATIVSANFLALSYIIKNILGPDPQKVRLFAFTIIKFALLIFIIFAVIKWAPVNIVAFLAGLSTMIISILCTTLIYSSGSDKR